MAERTDAAVALFVVLKNLNRLGSQVESAEQQGKEGALGWSEGVCMDSNSSKIDSAKVAERLTVTDGIKELERCKEPFSMEKEMMEADLVTSAGAFSGTGGDDGQVATTSGKNKANQTEKCF
ncbi:hypothetical protein VIGAN_02201700 [Vigna angularis var. angularis]|uniref:Uncharacterized protein n=1 Tax=Vigna angularis var. angularis TaxID=157739 RepID=A0A0S3REV4_PHAAN|nr:hypothetical protein VIGAN_02201700 [Vigna angularis var. angularis]